MKKARKREKKHYGKRILNEIPLLGAYRFRAENVDLDPKAYEGTSGDEGENTAGRCFYPRSNENRKRKDGAPLLRAATIFSEGQRERR